MLITPRNYVIIISSELFEFTIFLKGLSNLPANQDQEVALPSCCSTPLFAQSFCLVVLAGSKLHAKNTGHTADKIRMTQCNAIGYEYCLQSSRRLLHMAVHVIFAVCSVAVSTHQCTRRELVAASVLFCNTWWSVVEVAYRPLQLWFLRLVQLPRMSLAAESLWPFGTIVRRTSVTSNLLHAWFEQEIKSAFYGRVPDIFFIVYSPSYPILQSFFSNAFKSLRHARAIEQVVRDLPTFSHCESNDVLFFVSKYHGNITNNI